MPAHATHTRARASAALRGGSWAPPRGFTPAARGSESTNPAPVSLSSDFQRLRPSSAVSEFEPRAASAHARCSLVSAFAVTAFLLRWPPPTVLGDRPWWDQGSLRVAGMNSAGSHARLCPPHCALPARREGASNFQLRGQRGLRATSGSGTSPSSARGTVCGAGRNLGLLRAKLTLDSSGQRPHQGAELFP